MYKLTNKIEVDIHPEITPRALKGLSALGLLTTASDKGNEADTIFGLFTDEDKLKTLSKIIFVINEEPVWDEINIAEWMRGYKDFFMQLTKSLS